MSIIEIIKNIKDNISAQWLRIFAKPIPVAEPPAVEIAEPEHYKPVKKLIRRSEKIEAEHTNFGSFYYFDDLLDKLDSYFKYLKHLKRQDPGAFDLYSRVGGQVMGCKALFEHSHGLTPAWLQLRPSFGMAHISNQDDEKEDKINVKLMYFQKVKSPPDVQAAKGDIYRITMYYVETKRPKIRCCFSWHVLVLEDGFCQVLKERRMESIRVGKGHKRETFVRKSWGIPPDVTELFRDHKIINNNGASYGDIHDFATNVFAILANACMYSNDGVRINVMKNGLVGNFNIATVRTPYFFKDRQRVVNANGKTARIFHVTRPHKRTLANGKEILIKMHFKGLRKFDWKGYKVNITVPGIHHADLSNFKAPVEIAEEGANSHEGKLDMAQAGDHFQKHVWK